MRICKKCLIRDLEEKSSYENMFTYIKQLDEEIKVCEKTYEKRLAYCRDCEALINGICKYCGCFVEMRAAVIKNVCPVNRWDS